MSYVKYKYEILKPIVDSSKSVAEVIRKLNLHQAGGTHSHISKKIKQYNIDTSHFTGQAHSRDKKCLYLRKNLEDVLLKRTSGNRQRAVVLRRALVESGFEYKCFKCGIDKWNEKQISLQVNHKNRNWLDDSKENLEFLCPNCHSQTDGWCGSKYEISLFSDKETGRRARLKKKNKS